MFKRLYEADCFRKEQQDYFVAYSGGTSDA